MAIDSAPSVAAHGSRSADGIARLLGRRYGEALLARFPKFAPAAERVQA